MQKAWSEEFKTIRERIKPYHSPLPKRKPRITPRREHPGKCTHYDCLDCFFLSLQQYDENLCREVCNTLLICYEEVR